MSGVYKVGELYLSHEHDKLVLLTKPPFAPISTKTLEEAKILLAAHAFVYGSFHPAQLRVFHYLQKGDIPLTTFRPCNECYGAHLNDSYSLIKQYYHGKKAKRSGVDYINHIDEGLDIISQLYCRHLIIKDELIDDIVDIYCLHPIAQNGETAAHPKFELAKEYARIANSYLSKDEKRWQDIKLSAEPSVNLALLVDKLQNYSDLRAYHRSHPRYHELESYFKNWIEALREKKYQINLISG